MKAVFDGPMSILDTVKERVSYPEDRIEIS